MNKNEVGRVIAVNVGEDISSASAFEIILTHNKYSLTLGAADGVTRPAVDLVFTPCPSGTETTYLANQYLLYTTKAGDIPFAGVWQGRSSIQYTGPTADFNGDEAQFIVGE